MSARISRNIHHLRRLCKVHSSERHRMLKNAYNDCLTAICEIAHNVLKGTIPLSTHQYNKMRTHKNTLRAIGRNKSVANHKRKKILCQSGGFLPALLGLALPFLHTLITSSR